ncbi:hypothetical protein V511_08545 [Mesotoga sp. Brook.08.YT.4.2.5.1]|nr:hypothetical protein V511_08545 [Mesotoga sp. Brook.08.YT.4.2.5.1]PXF33722.1 hypothetical protein EU77_11840 [Mesotoga sp. SC_NapDC]
MGEQLFARKSRHSDKAPGRNLDALTSMALTKNEEQILAMEEQVFSLSNGEPFIGEPLSLLFPTPNLPSPTPVPPKPRS